MLVNEQTNVNDAVCQILMWRAFACVFFFNSNELLLHKVEIFFDLEISDWMWGFFFFFGLNSLQVYRSQLVKLF